MTRALCLKLAVYLAPLLAAPLALGQDDEDGAFDRTPRDCVIVSNIDEFEAVDDQNLIFHMRGREVLRNHLPRRCPGLERENRIAYETKAGRRLCSSDTITVLEDSGFGGFRPGFTCRLGEFVPLSPEEVEDLDRPEDSQSAQSAIETTEVDLPPAEPAEPAEEPAAGEESRRGREN
jgi:hypothetical protein